MNAVASPRRTPIEVGTDLTPLIPPTGSGPTATLVVATRPGPHLAAGDARRLLRMAGALDRRLHRVDPDDRRGIVRRIGRLARLARALPARNGLALVASSTDSALVHLVQPVCDRLLVGPVPSRLEILEQAWSPGPIAILLVGGNGARLVVSEAGVLHEPTRSRPLLRAVPATDGAERRSSVVIEAEALVARHVAHEMPLVVAGDPRVTGAVADARPIRDRAPVVLAGDHSGTAPATVTALAERALRRTLDADQRSAMVSVAVALEDGHVAAGLSEVLTTVPRCDDLLVIERGLLAAARSNQGPWGLDDPWPAVPSVVEHVGPVTEVDEWTAVGLGRLIDDVTAGRGRVVGVPDGFLAVHERIALAPDHRIGLLGSDLVTS